MVTKATTKTDAINKTPTAVKAQPEIPAKNSAKTKSIAHKSESSVKPAVKSVTTTISHEFSLESPDAKDVFLVGEFNNWDVTALRMKKSKKGTFTISVKLAPGRYEYLFNVDGQWMTDPAGSELVKNPFGSENSVLTLA